MKLQDWIQFGGYVLLAIATFAGPVVAARRSRRDQDNVIPDKRAEGWYSRLLKSLWLQSLWILPPLLILNYIVQLVFDLHKTGPVTRGQIFYIAFDMGGVVWGAVLLAMVLIGKELVYLSDTIRNLLSLQRDIVSMVQDLYRTQAEIDRDIVETLKATASREAVGRMLDIVESMNAELEKVKQKTVRRTGIAGLFGR